MTDADVNDVIAAVRDVVLTQRTSFEQHVAKGVLHASIDPRF